MVTVPGIGLHLVYESGTVSIILCISCTVCNTAIRFSAHIALSEKLEFAIRILPLQIASKTWVLL
jgi:hypothetical protein